MIIFGGKSNCFSHVNAKVSVAPGARISFKGRPMYPIKDTIITEIATTSQEKYSLLTCFNDVNHIFAFGKDIAASTLRVSLVTYIPFHEGGTAWGLPAAFTAYDMGRLSNDVEVWLTIGKLLIKGRLTKMDTTPMGNGSNLQKVVLTLIMEDVKSG